MNIALVRAGPRPRTRRQQPDAVRLDQRLQRPLTGGIDIAGQPPVLKQLGSYMAQDYLFSPLLARKLSDCTQQPGVLSTRLGATGGT